MTDTLVGTPDPGEEPEGVGKHLRNALTSAHDLLADKIDARKRRVTEDTLHQMEVDLAPIIGPIVQQILESPGASEEIKAVMREAGTPAHQFGSIVIGFALGATIGPALGSALQPELEAIANHAWTLNPSRYVSADVAAAAVLKGVFDQAHGAGIAENSGYNADQFDHLVQTAGQSIGLELALLLWRRGQIDDGMLQQIVQYSNINRKFYDVIPLAKYVPPSIGESIAGALKHHLDPEIARRNVGYAGVDPDNFDWMLASAGRPLGLEQTLHLWNRGIVDEAFVRQSIAQSDINPDYTEAALELRHYYPPPRSVVPMLRSGAITEAEARQLLTFYGVGEPWQTAFIREGQHAGSSAVKQLTQAQIVSSYENRTMDRPTALARLEALTYSAEDANALLDLADEKRVTALQNATVAMVGRRYVAYALAKADAAHLLATADVPNPAQLDLFRLWDIERDANVHVPSPAAIVGAGRRHLLSPAQVRTRLLERGIDLADIQIFVADGWPPTHPNDALAAAHAVAANADTWPVSSSGSGASGKTLTVTQIGKLYTAGTIGRAEALADLEALGYTAQQAAELLTTYAQPATPTP